MAAFLAIVVVPVVFTPFSWHPFIDGKLVVAALAALLFALRAETFRTRLVLPVAVWVAASAAAAGAGTDVWQSLLGRENQGNGLLLIVVCGVFLLAGTGVPERLRDRIPAWIVGAGVVVAAIGMLAIARPGIVQSIFGRPMELEFLSGLPPFGHPVFLGSFLAVAVVAAVPLAARRPVVAAAAIAVCASGIAVTGKRGALIAAIVGAAVAMLRCRIPRQSVAVVVMSGTAAVGLWTVVDLVARPAQPVAAARRFDDVLSGSAGARPYVWSSGSRALLRRPLLGWGPANTWGANMSVATQEEARMTGRVWQDAHNIVVESFVTTGFAGGLALLVVLGLSIDRMRRGPPAAGWAAGGVIALGVHHLLQPTNVAVTPLLFLLLGIAGTERRRSDLSTRGGMRVLAVAILAVGLPVAALRLVSSTMEADGTRYFDASFGSLRAAVALQPGSISAASHLAKQLAVDARGGAAGEERAVRALVASMVARHQWDPSVRLAAADVEMILNRPDRAAAWLDHHLERFRNDALALAYRGFVAERLGDAEAAKRFRDRSLSLEPNGPAVFDPMSRDINT